MSDSSLALFLPYDVSFTDLIFFALDIIRIKTQTLEFKRHGFKSHATVNVTVVELLPLIKLYFLHLSVGDNHT